MMSSPSPVFNFSAGPAVLPPAVLQTAQQELLDYNGTGVSILEMSHRSDAFLSILHHAQQDLRQLLNIPPHYQILFLQGGASTQFSTVALNLAHGFKRIDSVVTGNWSAIAHQQMGKLSNVEVHLSANAEKYGFKQLPTVSEWDWSPDSAFIHLVMNETVNGLQYRQLPVYDAQMPPIVCDMSSEILSRPINVADYGVIYAGAQKNIGPAGATVVIVREDLLQRCNTHIPDVWNYQKHLSKDGMHNTPCTFAIYLSGLVFRWLQAQGGITKMQEINQHKAQLLYQAIDNSGGFYQNTIAPEARSHMNVVFSCPNSTLDQLFVQHADWHGLRWLNGYKTVGGMRASLYNAMPVAGVQALVDFMAQFQQRFG